MAYSKTTWVTGDVITAEKLNNIENKVEELDGASGDVEQVRTELTAQIEGVETELSGSIDALDERVAQAEAAVGAPMVASTVAGMTDHTKVYVYTGSETGYTSGNWYYWNGSAWTSGGVYNAVAVDTDKTLSVANKAADGKKVGDEISELKSAVPQFVAECPAEGWDVFQLTDNGIWTIRESRKAACTNLPPVTNGALTLISQKTKHSVTLQRIFDQAGNVFVCTVNNSTHVAITDWANSTVQQTGSSTIVSMSQKAVTDALDLKIDKSMLIETYVNGNPTITDKLLTYASSGNIIQSTNNSYVTFEFDISGAEVFKISGATRGSSNYICIYADENGGYLGKIGTASSSTVEYTDEIVTISDVNARKAYICLYNPIAYNVKVRGYKTTYDDEQDTRISALSAYGNRYIGKKIVCFGDSRTWYDGHAYTDKTKSDIRGETCVGYQQQLRDLLGATVVSQGVSGETSAEICTRIRAFDFTGYDAVLLEGGVNDFVKSGEVTIGELLPIGSTFDTTTVYGAWQSAVEYIATNYPLVKIYMDIPAIAWLGANDDAFPYSIAEIKGKVAELYSIPCKDLYKTSGINKVNRDAFYCDDTSLTNNWHLHFNDEGNAWLGAELAQFINDN